VEKEINGLKDNQANNGNSEWWICFSDSVLIHLECARSYKMIMLIVTFILQCVERRMCV